MTALLVTMLPLSEGDLSSQEKNQIRSGLDSGKAIANLMSSGNFKESMKKIGTSIGKYLGVLSPFIGLVLASESVSSEIRYMKNMMREIDTRFDQLNSRVDEIERKIEWTAKEVTFVQIEVKILAMVMQYELIFDVPSEATADQKTRFVQEYNNNYENSGYFLYLATVGNTTFLKDLGVSVMRYTENDRKKTDTLLLGTMQLLLQAAKMEIAYLQVKNSAVLAEHLASVWEERIMEVKDKFNEIDSEVKSKYHEQSSVDIDEYAEDNEKMSNKDFAHGLKNMLKDKYYWRIWLVIIYNPISGSQNHFIFRHGGHGKFRQNGRNIVVASKDKNSPRMSSNTAESRLNSARADSYRPSAKDVFYTIKPADNAGSWGVVTHGNGISYAWSGGTFKESATFHVMGLGFDLTLTVFDLFMWG